MVSPSDSMRLVGLAIDESGLFPDSISYLFHEADLQNQDADKKLPLIEIEPTTAEHVNPNNTDLVGYVTDDNGNRTGEIYYAEYELTIEIDIWTSADGAYDVDDLGELLREALYPYSSHGPQEPLRYDDGEAVDSIFRFNINSGERQDEVIRTPTVRRWRHEVELWGYEEFKTTEEYIVDINTSVSVEAE